MNRMLEFFVRTSIIAMSMVLLGWILYLVVPAKEVASESGGFVDAWALPFLSAFVLAAALAYPIRRSRARGKSLVGIVFLAVFGLMTVLTLVEAALFLQMTTRELSTEFLKNILIAAALSWLTVTLYPKLDHEPAAASTRINPPTTASWIRRWVGVSLIYVVLYITAGLLILPIIKTWYEAQGTLAPDPAFFFPFQIARGALFVAFVLPLLRSMSGTRWQASLSLAVMIPLVHGVAGLIPPNPFMPDYVRHAHMIEIGWSNFVLGLLIGYLFWNPVARVAEPVQSLEEAA